MTRRSRAGIVSVATVLLFAVATPMPAVAGGAGVEEETEGNRDRGSTQRLKVPIRRTATPSGSSAIRIAIDGRAIVSGEGAARPNGATSRRDSSPSRRPSSPPSSSASSSRSPSTPTQTTAAPVVRDSADPALILTSHGAGSGSATPAQSADRGERRREDRDRPSAERRIPTSRESAKPGQEERGHEERGAEERNALDPDGFVLGPGDVLDVFVWKNPDLSREMPIRPDGKISLPLVGEIQAAGKTPPRLRAEIEAGLEDYLQVPTVTVSVLEINSMMVYVLGNVGTPGPLSLDRYTTVMQALSMAGGLNEFADEDDITVLRTVDGRQRRIAFDYDDVVEGKNPELDVVLQPGDVIHVP